MAYKALYRTYRPQSFSEIIGQETIVKTLQNEIKENKVSHAYLFCGPRGTGKTSIARVFAKALNCPHLVNGEPCNECSTCKEITEGVNPDVIEIDAASNNGVDEIRAMKDRIGFLPAGSKYKIYIIDEVHMLSTSAFNAFLKTLEEPPKHVIFILATTEPQKILSTVLSRCQRYDFKSLTVDEILDVLEKVCIEEDTDYDKEALVHIAKASDGGLRDALSYLDQAISYCGDKITDEDAANVTGTVAKDKLFALTKAMKDKNLTESITLINELQNSGKEVSKIVNSLLEFYRDILMVKNIKDSHTDQRYIDYANQASFDEIFYYIDVLSDVQNKIKFSNSTSIYLQVAIIRIINTSSIDLDYQKRLSALEEKINNIGVANVSDNTVSCDNSSVKELEDKYNNLLAYLNKLGIQSFNDRIKAVETNQLSVSSNNNKELEGKVYKVIEDIEFLKVTYNGMRNAVDNANNGGISDEDLVIRVEEAAKKYKPSINYTEIETFVKKQIEGVMDEVRKVIVDESNKVVDEKLENFKSEMPLKAEEQEVIEDSTVKEVVVEKVIETKEIVVKPEGLTEELEARLKDIETKIYKLMTDMLQRSQKDQKKNKPRVDEKQISFWGGDIVETDKASSNTKVKAQFEGLDDSLIVKDKNEEVIESLENQKEETIFDKVEIDQQVELVESEEVQVEIEGDSNQEATNVVEEETDEDAFELVDLDEPTFEEIDAEETNSDEAEDVESEEDEEVNLFAEDDKDILLDDEVAKENKKAIVDKQRLEEKREERERKVAELLIEKRKELEQKDFISEEEKINEKQNVIEEDYFENENVFEDKSSENANIEEKSEESVLVENTEESQNVFENEVVSNEIEQEELNQESDNQEVINQEESELVDEENESIDVDEKTLEANLFGNVSNNETNIEEEIKKATIEDLDDYERYEIKVLERILNESREVAYTGERERILKLWTNLVDLASSDKRGTAEILAEGVVRAVGNHEIVITYDTARMCNQVMSRKFKRNSLKLLYDLLGDDYNYLAITLEQWTLKRQEYANQYVIGIKYPKLTPFTDPNLKVVINEDDEDDAMKKVIIDIFGTNVNFKKE